MKTVYLTLSLKSTIQLYILKIKIGNPFKSRLRIAIDEFPSLLKKQRSVGFLFG